VCVSILIQRAWEGRCQQGRAAHLASASLRHAAGQQLIKQRFAFFQRLHEAKLLALKLGENLGCRCSNATTEGVSGKEQTARWHKQRAERPREAVAICLAATSPGSRTSVARDCGVAAARQLHNNLCHLGREGGASGDAQQATVAHDPANEPPHDVAAPHVGGQHAVRNEVRHRARVVAHHLQARLHSLIGGCVVNFRQLWTASTRIHAVSVRSLGRARRTKLR
jgi:hypothetical protein